MLRHLLAVVLFLGIASPAVATPLLVNGDFETGDFTGWLRQSTFSTLLVTTPSAHDGTFGTDWFGPATLGPGFGDTLSQGFATDVGVTYRVSFWLRHIGTPCGPPNFGDCDENYFLADWNNTRLLQTFSNHGFAYREYSFDVAATTSTTTLRFEGGDNPARYHLDDVRVTAVPEPSTLLLLSGGVAALAKRRRAR